MRLLNSTTQPMAKRPASMAGPAALLAAVIHQALVDYHRGDETAASYFAGPVYRTHLAQLGLPGDWLPEGVNL